mmetsp:Transcript_9387/g.32445  ORF Transcript_9387/g.32445 Transcript_9387/m.32445 type:complete len:332 (+) Transcript_9387:909-1904(+)
MCVDADEVAEAVGHEDRPKVGRHHLVEVSRQEPARREAREDRPLRQGVHVEPGHSRLHGCDHLGMRVQHGLVHDPLLRGELSRRRKSAGDIRRVPVVLPARIDQHEAAVWDLARVGRAAVPVVQERAVLPSADDGSIGREPAATARVAVVQELGLELELHHAGFAGLHHPDMGVGADFADVTHHLHLLGGLRAPAVAQGLVEHVRGDLEAASVAEPRGVRLHREAAVGVRPLEQVDALRLQTPQLRREVVRVHHLVHPVLLLEGLQARYCSKPDGELLRQSRHEERCAARLHFNEARAVGFLDTKEVVKKAFLSKQVLVVRVVSAGILTTS